VATQPFAFPTPILDPFGATATAQAQFAFPTPVLDPFGATATAQAQFAFPTPVLDPFGATATAQAQIAAFPTPILDPFGATATAQAQFSPLPTPMLDPFAAATATAQAAPVLPAPLTDTAADPVAATSTAQALLNAPALDAFAATAIAQAATISASLGSGQVAVLPSLPDGAVLILPGRNVTGSITGIITVTATFTPEPPAALAQRPVEPPTPPPSVDSRAFFVRVLDSAGSTVALLWFLGGSVLFFVTAGVLAGLSFRAKEQGRFALEPGGDSDKFVAQPADDQLVAGQTEQPANKTKTDDNWPASLP
jgi:hypothetical protein